MAHKDLRACQGLEEIRVPVGSQESLASQVIGAFLVSTEPQENLDLKVNWVTSDCQVILVWLGDQVQKVRMGYQDPLGHVAIQGSLDSQAPLVIWDLRVFQGWKANKVHRAPKELESLETKVCLVHKDLQENLALLDLAVCRALQVHLDLPAHQMVI